MAAAATDWWPVALDLTASALAAEVCSPSGWTPARDAAGAAVRHGRPTARFRWMLRHLPDFKVECRFVVDQRLADCWTMRYECRLRPAGAAVGAAFRSYQLTVPTATFPVATREQCEEALNTAWQTWLPPDVARRDAEPLRTWFRAEFVRWGRYSEELATGAGQRLAWSDAELATRI